MGSPLFRYVQSVKHSALSQQRLPSRALANGRWIGNVPLALIGLTFMEKILIARYCHNRCIVRVDIHAPFKMCANAVVFSQPVAKLLEVLPMPRAELDQIVAVLFTGSVTSTVSDFQYTPVFVRPLRVWAALLWLEENHSCYKDVRLSQDNLRSYLDGDIPVAFFYQRTSAEEPQETLGVSDSSRPSGTSGEMSPLSVHGVTEEGLVSMSFNEQALRAMQHNM